MAKNELQIAQDYGHKIGYDIVTLAGERNGYKYFHLTAKRLIGRKTGTPRFVKINKTGRTIFVENLTEIMWANQQVRENLEKFRDG